MPLNIGSGHIKPFVKYNSKADKWYLAGDQEIGRPTFIADFDNLVTGWFLFREGQAPQRRIDPSLDRAAPSPGEDFKKGFVVMLHSQQHFNGAVEFCSTSIYVGNAIAEIYALYEEQRDQHDGELPVVACTGAVAERSKYGTSYRPIFTIAKWTPRPAELPDEAPVDPADVWKPDLLTPARPRPQLARPAADASLQTEF